MSLESPPDEVASTWDGEPLHIERCLLGDLGQRLPVVERRPFAVASPGTLTIGLPAANPYYDVIVRLPDDRIRTEVPVGIVSKKYRLVQHAELVDGVIAGLEAADVQWESLPTTVRLTDLGSRLHFTVHLPKEFRAEIGDDRLDLTIECLNSVERSRSLRVGMGWIRHICGNGLFIGRVTASLRRAHVWPLDVEDVPRLVAGGFQAAKIDEHRWQVRAQTEISNTALERWVDSTLVKRWGVVAATRALHIAQTGYDARPADARDDAPASRRRVVRTDRVPGSDPPNANVFRIGQILAWLADRPGEWGARLERRHQISQLLAPLRRATSNAPSERDLEPERLLD